MKIPLDGRATISIKADCPECGKVNISNCTFFEDYVENHAYDFSICYDKDRDNYYCMQDSHNDDTYNTSLKLSGIQCDECHSSVKVSKKLMERIESREDFTYSDVAKEKRKRGNTRKKSKSANRSRG